MEDWRGEETPSTVGGYRIVRRIGAGGMGVVHLAVSPSGRRVALKIIRNEFVDDPDRRARFRLEIDAARQVSGAFTASVVDADPDAEPPWMATQYFDAPTLAERVREQGPFEEGAVWQLGRGLAEALRDIHRAGLVHRDLKPSNVLLTDDGPRVIDFGIARMLQAEPLTRTDKILGTVSFMAPEQLNTPREVGAAADVFALGGVLTQAATGRGPFSGDTGTPPITVAMQIIHDDPDLTGVPAALRSVIERCLLKDPAGRPSPVELLALLQEDQTHGTAGARAVNGSAQASASGPGAGAVTGAAPASASTPAPAPAFASASASTEPGGPTRDLRPRPRSAPSPAPAGTGRTETRPSRKPAMRRASAYALAVSSAVLAGVLTWALLPDGGTGNGPSASPGAHTGQANGAGRPATDSCSKGITTGGSKDRQGKKITIGLTIDRPGLALKRLDGTYQGLDVDVARYVANKLGYPDDEIVWKEVPICHRVEALQKDVVDLVVSEFTRTMERSTQVDFTSPYLTGHQDVLLPADARDVHDGKDLSGKVCTVRGSTAAANFARTFGPKATMVTGQSVEHCVQKLVQRTVKAVTADDTALAYAATMEPGTFKLAGLRLTDEPYAIGLRKGNPIKDEVTAALKQMVADSSMLAFQERNVPLLVHDQPD